MIKNQILSLLKEHKNNLKQYQVQSIYLFGSVARGEEGPKSDIDILVAFEGPGSFDQYMDLKFYLEDLFKRKIDLVTEAGLRPELINSVKQDLIRAA
jgi:uncharacterized protein